MSKRLLVVGSANIDYVVGVDIYPAPGETRRGTDLEIWLGGKGANQAVAAGRLVSSASVKFAGQVGDDDGGRALRAGLEAAGVDTTSLLHVTDRATGSAVITRLPGGNNSIIISPGANGTWYADAIAQLKSSVEAADIVLLQLEIPLDVVQIVAREAKTRGSLVILDPAPAMALPAELLQDVSLITPNESEACILLGEKPHTVSTEDLPKLLERLRVLTGTAVLLKAGDRGAFYSDGTSDTHCPAFVMNAVVDTTAAGDTYNGAYAVAVAEGLTIEAAMRFASAAAGISVTRRGAQSSIPNRADVEQFLASQMFAFPEMPLDLPRRTQD